MARTKEDFLQMPGRAKRKQNMKAYCLLFTDKKPPHMEKCCDLKTSHLAWAFTQIKPGAKSISYVKVQRQLRGYNGCGPLSLSYFSSIVRKINPHSFEYQHEQILRTTVRRIVETGTLENLIPRMTEKSIRIPKSIIRTYKRASSTNVYLQ